MNRHRCVRCFFNYLLKNLIPWIILVEDEISLYHVKRFIKIIFLTRDDYGKRKGVGYPVEQKCSIFSFLRHFLKRWRWSVCDQEVNWAMEVICHGLCLPLTDHEIIRDCVSIYCEWLSALLPNPKICVPRWDSFCSFIHLLIYDDHIFAIRRCSWDTGIKTATSLCKRSVRYGIPIISTHEKISGRDCIFKYW